MPMNLARSGLGEKYATADLETAAQEKRVFATEDDGFVVVLESPDPTADRLRDIIDNCQSGEVFVVPVDDAMDIPKRYLSQVGADRLKATSLALGSLDDEDRDGRLLRYVEALGAVGVQSVRTVGRGAFPFGTYPWDGLIPVDLTIERPQGHFTTLEFDQGWDEIFATYHLLKHLANRELE
jgi:hypothetical protein